MITLLQSTYAEAIEQLANARSAQVAGAITAEQYAEYQKAVFDAIADNINIAELFGDAVSIESAP